MCNCEWCGKPIKQQRTGRSRKYCSNRCKKAAYHERQKQKCLNIPDNFLSKNPLYRIEDHGLRFTYQQPQYENKESWFTEDEEIKYGGQELEFTENDNNWGLGESNLNEHSTGDKNLEAAYVEKELKRIFTRKPNP